MAKESTCSAGDKGEVSLIPGSGRWQPTPVFLPEKSRGQRSLVGYSPWGRKESYRSYLTEPSAHNAGLLETVSAFVCLKKFKVQLMKGYFIILFNFIFCWSLVNFQCFRFKCTEEWFSYICVCVCACVCVCSFSDFFFFFLAAPCSMWDLSSPVRNWAHVPCRGRVPNTGLPGKSLRFSSVIGYSIGPTGYWVEFPVLHSSSSFACLIYGSVYVLIPDS